LPLPQTLLRQLSVIVHIKSSDRQVITPPSSIVDISTDMTTREVRMRPAWQCGTAFRHVHACCPPLDAPALHVEPAHARSVTAMHYIFNGVPS